MRKLPLKTYVKVIKCSENHHNGRTGHVVGNRVDKKGWNLKLTNHFDCFATKVEVLSIPPKKIRVRLTTHEISVSVFMFHMLQAIGLGNFFPVGWFKK